MTDSSTHFDRRRCITGLVGAVIGLAGCQESNLPVEGDGSGESTDSTSRGDNELGLSETRADLEVVVNEARAIDELEFQLENTGNETMVPPETGELYIAEVGVTNNDVESRAGPAFLVQDYQLTELDEYQSEQLRNDILFYSGEEKGAVNLPEVVDMTLYDGLAADGEEIEPYPPTSVGGPEIQAGESVTGWVFGIVESEAVARLMVHWDGESSFWAVNQA